MNLRRSLVPALGLWILAGCGSGNSARSGSGPLVDVKGAIKTLDATYVVVAWSQFGIQVVDPFADLAIFPPNNALRAQVIRRGDPPAVVTAGLTVRITTIGKADASGKPDPAGPAKTVNLDMAAVTDHFEAGIDPTGIPGGPYSVAEVVVKEGDAEVAKTYATVPISNEVNCAKCHKDPDTVTDILAHHVPDLTGNPKPVICSSCHASPVRGALDRIAGVQYLSEAVHGFHGNLPAEQLPACYDCHPGATTKFSRSTAHIAEDPTGGNCTVENCHPDMATMAAAITADTVVPWVNEPECSFCHGNLWEVYLAGGLFRESQGHGGVWCGGCHGSPHAMVPSREPTDDVEPLQYQSKASTLGTCSPCHDGSKGQSPIAHFNEEHAGSRPKNATACAVCHTLVPESEFDYGDWPHAFTWQNRR